MNHIPHGLGCAWALPSCMTYTAKYGRREDLAETADAMGVAYKDSDDAMVIAKAISDVLVAFMKELAPILAPACITTLLKIIMGKISDGCGGAWREMKQALEDALTKENREEHTETR